MPGVFDFTERLVNLSPVELATLMRRVLELEAARLNLPYGSVGASQRVTVTDEGEDGFAVDVPEGVETRLPTGRTLFQFKTNASRTSVEAEVRKEVKESPRPRAALEAGDSYVVVWPKDAVGKERDALLAGLKEEVGDKFAEQVDVWSVSILEEILNTNPAALIEQRLIPGMSVLTLKQWAPGARAAIPSYVPDAERSAKIAQIRQVILEGSETFITHMHGDAGVGKTRLALEALDIDEIRDQVVYATPESVGAFVNYVISLPAAHCILFVDDIDATELDRLRQSIQPTLGRIRLLTAGLPGGYRLVRPSGNDMELGGLSGAALESLIRDQVGLPDAAAKWVAEVSDGYPRLAIIVAELIKAEPESLSVGQTIANLDVQVLLDKMLPDTRLQEHLGVVALFSQIGVEGSRSVELEAVATAFGLDRAVLRQTLEQEDGRFVSRAGGLRSITPRLVAVWLASKVIADRGIAIAKTIGALPYPLPDRFRDQLVYLKDSPMIRHVVDELLKRPEFEDPAAFDQAAAAFLRAAAAANPEQVAKILSDLFAAFDDETLKSADFPRRDVVWALEQLLWPEATYETAVDLLLRLAENETEAFANNATGVLVDSFQLLLGGTEASYPQRLSWIDSKVDPSIGPVRLEILASCLASGLRGYQVRSHGSRPDETGVRDWHPDTWEEELEARQGAWSRLVQVVSESSGSVRREVFPKLVESVRQTLDGGLADVVLNSLDEGEWGPEERAALTGPLHDVLRYDRPGSDWQAKIQEVIDRLSGDTFSDRVRVLFRQRIWDLRDDRRWDETPEVIVEMADEAASDQANVDVALEATEELEDLNTAYVFWREVARLVGPKELAVRAGVSSKGSLAVYQAALSIGQADDPGWVDIQLEESLRDPDRAKIGVQLVQAVGINDSRATLLLDAVADGRTPAEELSGLLYGAMVRDLSQTVGVGVIKTLADVGSPTALEHAIGMLQQYAEVDDDFLVDPAHRELATELATSAVSFGDGSPMRYHYAYELAESLPVEEGLGILRARMVSQETLPETAEVELLNRAFENAPDVARPWALEVLDEATSQPYPRWSLWIEGFRLLTRAAQAGDAVGVWDWFQRQDQSAQVRLVRHVNFGLAKPDEFIELLLSGSNDEAVLSEASAAFFNSLGTVAGPYHLGLERQVERLRVWQVELDGAAREWVDQQIASYERLIPEQRRREEEEDALLQ